jgi:hypothetical protein
VVHMLVPRMQPAQLVETTAPMRDRQP